MSLLGTTALATSLVLLAAAGPALAGQKPVLPSGGGFAAGTGTISSSGRTLTVTQSSLRGIINWSSFSIGRGGLVSFENGSGATLNRVTGAQESRIFGTLSATGSVYLLNPNGVLIGKSGQVNTGGSFLASTLDTSDAAFMTGGGVVLAGSSTASVRNYGTIAATGGNVFLVARTVQNSGSIAAANGEAGLAAGQQVLLQDSASDPRIFVQAPGGDVTNKGKIAAAAVALKAVGGNVYALAGNNGGQISATGTAVINGHVWLTASGGGSVTASGQVSAQNADGSGGTVTVAGDPTRGSATVTGTIDVSATAPGKTGGRATVTAATVTVGATAAINATGDAGGGTVEVGGGLHGADAKVADAQNTTVAAGATINASATGTGNGGAVAVWSNGTTVFNGSIVARGGPGGGNGGMVETSGHYLGVGATAMVDTLAPRGAVGTWLLDPENITIATGGTGSLASNTYADQPTGSITIDPTTIDAAASNVLLQANTDIMVNNAIAMTNAGVSLELDAGRSILVNANISTNNGNITLLANDPAAIAADRQSGNAAITMASGTTLNAGTGALSLTLSTGGANGDVTLDSLIANSVTVTSSGAIYENEGTIVSATSLAIDAAGPVTMTGPNRVSTLAFNVTGSGNGIAFRDEATALTIGTVGGVVGGTTDGGQIQLTTTTSGSITVSNAIASGGGEIDIAAAPGFGITNTTAAIASGGGNIVLLGDTIALGGGTGTVDAGSGTLLLAPSTASDNIILGAASSTGTLGLQTADFATVTAGQVQIGYRNEDGSTTGAFSGNITVSTAGVSFTEANIPAVLLVTGASGTVSSPGGGSLTFDTGGSLGVVSGGGVILESGANAVGTFAAFTDGGAGSPVAFVSLTPLTIGTMPKATLGVAVAGTTGIASSAAMATGGGLPSNALSGVTTTNATFAVEGGNSLAVNAPINVGTAGVGLISSGSITEGSSGAINAGALEFFNAGAITLDNGNNMLAGAGGTAGRVAGDDEQSGAAVQLAFAGSGTVQIDSLDVLVGGFGVGPFSGITSTNGAISLTTMNSTNLALNAPIAAGSGAVTLTSSGTISESGSGKISTTGTLTTSSAGGTMLNGANAVGSVNATNTASGNIALTNTAATLTVLGVAQSGGGGLTIGNNGNLLTQGMINLVGNGNIALTATGGDLSVAGEVFTGSLGSVTLTTTGAGNGIAIDAPVAGETITLSSAGAITGSRAVEPATLVTTSSVGGTTLSVLCVHCSANATNTGSGDISLSFAAPGAVITGVSQSGGGGVTISSTGALTLEGAVNAGANGSIDLTATDMTVNGAISSGSGGLSLTASGSLTLASGASLTTGASGNAIVLSAAGDFINDAGAGALSVGAGGRWLVYSAAPAGDSFGGLDSNNTAIWNATLASLPPASVSQSGDRYLFALQPTAIFTANTVSKTYGTAVDLSTAYTVSGLQPGVANAYLGDTFATAFTGAPSLGSAGAAATAGAGSYTITIAQGSLTSPSGYAFGFLNGQLTVGQATLTYVANPVVRLLGEPNPVFTGTVTGLNGATGVSGTALFTSTATIASGPGRYAIDGSGLFAGAGNYVFVEAPGNATALTVEPFGLPNVLPPSSTQLLGQQAPTFRAASPAPLLANLAPLAGCRVTPDGDCLQPLAAATFSPLLPGSDGDRAAPVRPW